MCPSASVLTFLASLALAAPAMAAESVYTTMNVDDQSCEQMGDAPTQEEIDLGVTDLLCPGFKTYSIEYNTDDERTTVHFGDFANTTTTSVWESFLPFNSPGDKVEWRLDGSRVPYAAILRFDLGGVDPTDAHPPVRGQVLVISKVGQPGGPAGCVVGLVDARANSNANALARKIADQLAPGFACGKDKVAYHGKRGEKAADFQTAF